MYLLNHVCKPCKDFYIFIQKIQKIINNSRLNDKFKKYNDIIMKDMRNMVMKFCMKHITFCTKIAPLIASMPEGLPEDLLEIISIFRNNEKSTIEFINNLIDILNNNKSNINNIWGVLRCDDNFIGVYQEVYERLTGINFSNDTGNCIEFYESCGFFGYGDVLADDKYILKYYENKDKEYTLYSECGFIPFITQVDAKPENINLKYNSIVSEESGNDVVENDVVENDVVENEYKYEKLEKIQDILFTILPMKLPKKIIKSNIEKINNIDFLHII